MLLFVLMVSWRLAVDFFGMIAMACSGWGDNEASQHPSQHRWCLGAVLRINLILK